MLFRLLTLILALAFAAPAAADDTPATPPPIDGKEIISLHAFGLAHAECAEWSDGCAVCRREGCSLPGIACQPVEIACKAP